MAGQNNGEVYLDTRNPHKRLGTLNAWKDSAEVYYIYGVAANVNALSLKIGKVGKKEFYTPVEGQITADGRAWRVRVDPLYFPAGGQTLYKIVTVDDSGRRTVEGIGEMRVHVCPYADTDDGGQAIIPNDAYAYNPRTGLYHKMIATQNSTGEIFVEVEQEGIAK